MRSRLTFTLSAWLIGAVAISVLALGGFTSWHLSQGFTAYLQARDMERFDRFVALVANNMASSKAMPGTSDPDMPNLLRQLAMGEGLGGFRPNANAQEPHTAPPPMNRPPPRAGDGFGSRVALYWPDGRPWAGPPIDPAEPGVVERSVQVAGQTVALARLRRLAPASDAIEGQFLRQQFAGIATVAGALMLMALLSAVWLARQWIRPLVAVQDATARIARGELDIRIPTGRSDEIGDVVRNVNAMAESLQSIEGARRRWMADLSHELRTPLAVLRGEIEALVDGVRPLTTSAVLSLQEDALRLGALVDDLHLLAMADLQSLPCAFDEIDATDLVDSVIQRHARAAADAGLTLEWSSTRPAATRVQWDRRRIEQVLSNLVQNSLRYTDAPGCITIDLKTTPDCVQLAVEDSAPGLAPKDLARIFEPLYRADSARSRHNGGSGLGLAISAAIVHAHGGLISAHPSPLGGLRIEVDLPIQPEPVK
jgi:two-component system, OmpR family, sensor histidine kinase BaeS